MTEPVAERRGPFATRGRIALIVVVGVLALVAVADAVTGSPALCGSCHEMEPAAAAWAESAHVNVGCVSCHETPRAWYARPMRLAERGRLLARDVTRHLQGRYGEPADPSAVGRTSPMPDEVCLQCHTADRRATSGFRILIDHVEHAERTGSCVACHVYTAHPDAELGRPLSLMTRCFDCHGTAAEPAASAACATCHPADFDLRPPSHLADPWMRDHGLPAEANRELCAMCHQQAYCDSCHGVEMPHPEAWGGPGPAGHGPVGTARPEVCIRCHTERPDPCSACHHVGYDAAEGPWLEQHAVVARGEGTASCMECHEPTACARCHRQPPAPAEEP